jgi:IS30 family transposase
MKSYEHLTSETRAQIEILRKLGKGLRAIARDLRINPSTVSREVRRNRGPKGDYDGRAAHCFARARRVHSRRPVKLTGDLREEVLERLRAGHTPDQIAGRQRMKGLPAAERVSHETIYKMLGADRDEGGTHFLNLPRAGRKYRSNRCGTKRANPLGIKKEQELENRPAEINERSRLGDLEVDLVIGAEQKGVILVMTDRLSLHTQIASLPSKDADTVASKMKELLSGREVLSLTFDRGLEWARHEELARELGVAVYFCKPYHSWEKGTVENTNGRIRRFLPKRESFPDEEMDHAWLREQEEAMNNTPRKMLGYHTPREVEELWAEAA